MHTAVDVDRSPTCLHQLAQERAAVTAKFRPRQGGIVQSLAISSVSVSVWRGRMVGMGQV